VADRVRLKHHIEFAAFRAAMAGVRLLREERGTRMAARLGRLGHRLGVRGDLVERNLRLAFPGASDAWVRDTARAAWEHLGRETLMMLQLSWTSPEELLERTRIVNEGPARADYERGGGLVAVGGHLGNWEIAGAIVASRDYRVAAIAKSAANPLFYRRILAARQRLGVEVIDFQQATRGALRKLRAGYVVGFAADQHARAGIPVPFFGRPAATYRGPAVLALRTGAPMYLAMCLRQPDGTYELTLEPIATEATGDMEADVRRVTEAWVSRLEAAVRAHPEQYLWHHRRWRDVAAGAPEQEQDRASAV
jgi:Kdo2-lipid IVA lauroyltransferase/acyltransferase